MHLIIAQNYMFTPSTILFILKCYKIPIVLLVSLKIVDVSTEALKIKLNFVFVINECCLPHFNNVSFK